MDRWLRPEKHRMEDLLLVRGQGSEFCRTSASRVLALTCRAADPGGKGIEGLTVGGGTWFLYCSVPQLTQAPVQLTPVPTNWTVTSLVVSFWKKLKKHVRGISYLLLSEKQRAFFTRDWQLLHKLINR